MLRSAKNRQTVFLFILWLAQALITPWAGGTQRAIAQDSSPSSPAVTITSVDTSRFPEISVAVYGENLPADLATLSLVLTEDGAAITPTGDATQTGVAGTQTALVLDASRSVINPGPTGDRVHLEVGKAVRRLVQLELLSPDRDRLTALSFDPSQTPLTPHTLRDWDVDHQAVVDSLYIYKPNESAGNTSIDGLLDFTLRRFEDQSLPAGEVRSVILFSDGIDVFPVQGLFEAVQLAATRKIRIHTVQIGSNPDAAPRTKLQDLALQTGGQFFQLSSIEAVDAVWNLVAQGGTRRVITYRTTQAKPGKVAISVTMPDAKILTAESDVPLVAPPQAPTVRIIKPASAQNVPRSGPAFDTPPEQLTPNRMEVQIEVSFPDGFNRSLVSVEYEAGGKTEIVSGGFDQPYQLDISTLDAGEYTVRARAIDEVGLVGVSDPIPFRIVKDVPPPPTSTPDPALAGTATAVAITATQVAVIQATADVKATAEVQATATAIAVERERTETVTTTLTITNIVTAVLGLLALGYAIYLLSNRDRRKALTEVITGTVAAATQPFIRRSRPGGSGNTRGDQPRAQLRMLEDGGIVDAPQSIALSRTGLRIGRDPSVANIVLSDRHISKLHCRIVEDAATNGYRILDEGSTSGTYINEEEVNINGQVLRHGDVISIGPIQYQFEMMGQPTPKRNDDDEITSGTKIFEQDDSTQVYLRSPGGKSRTEPYNPDKG